MALSSSSSQQQCWRRRKRMRRSSWLNDVLLVVAVCVVLITSCTTNASSSSSTTATVQNVLNNNPTTSNTNNDNNKLKKSWHLADIPAFKPRGLSSSGGVPKKQEKYKLADIPAYRGGQTPSSPSVQSAHRTVHAQPVPGKITVHLRALKPDDQQKWYLHDLANVYNAKGNMYFCMGNDNELITNFRDVDLVMFNQHAVFSLLGFPSFNVHDANDDRNNLFLRALYRRTLELKEASTGGAAASSNSNNNNKNSLTIYLAMCSEQKPATRGELALAAAVEQLLFDECVDKDRVKLVYSELGKFHLSKKAAILSEKDVVNTQSNEFIKRFFAGDPVALSVLKINDQIYDHWSKVVKSREGTLTTTWTREDMRLSCRTPDASFAKLIAFILEQQKRTQKGKHTVSLFDKRMMEVVGTAFGISTSATDLPNTPQALQELLRSKITTTVPPPKANFLQKKCLFRKSFVTPTDFAKVANNPTAYKAGVAAGAQRTPASKTRLAAARYLDMF